MPSNCIDLNPMSLLGLVFKLNNCVTPDFSWEKEMAACIPNTCHPTARDFAKANNMFHLTAGQRRFTQDCPYQVYICTPAGQVFTDAGRVRTLVTFIAITQRPSAVQLPNPTHNRSYLYCSSEPVESSHARMPIRSSG